MFDWLVRTGRKSGLIKLNISKVFLQNSITMLREAKPN